MSISKINDKVVWIFIMTIYFKEGFNLTKCRLFYFLIVEFVI